MIDVPTRALKNNNFHIKSGKFPDGVTKLTEKLEKQNKKQKQNKKTHLTWNIFLIFISSLVTSKMLATLKYLESKNPGYNKGLFSLTSYGVLDYDFE